MTMNSEGICMEVLVGADEGLLGEFRIAELAPLLASVKHAAIAEPIETTLRLVPNLDIRHASAANGRRMGIIFISSQFLDGPPDAPCASDRARQLMSVKISAPIGLIAVSDMPVAGSQTRPPVGIDWIVRNSGPNPAALREAVEQVAIRLWYKVRPPSQPAGGASADSVVIDYVRSASELYQTFQLRYLVYDLLGYLEEPIRTSGSRIDVDAFDRVAIHLVARDVRQMKVVGCARLILPSRDVNRTLEESICCPDSFARWCEELAAKERSRVVRKRLLNGTHLELPGASMAAFQRLTRDMHTKHCCELSRLIVAPEYRGLDLSARLMETAIQLVSCLTRRIMLVECVPSHYQFYQSFGFKLGEEESEGPAAAHQLRTQAITMSLNLVEQNPKPKTKANLLVSMTSREMAPDSLRKLTGQLRRDLPLELWSPECRATQSAGEIKRMELPESSLLVHVGNGGLLSELAKAIAEILMQSHGLSVRVQERQADREFRPLGGRSPDWKSIRSSLLQLLQWTDPTTLNALS